MNVNLGFTYLSVASMFLVLGATLSTIIYSISQLFCSTSVRFASSWQDVSSPGSSLHRSPAHHCAGLDSFFRSYKPCKMSDQTSYVVDFVEVL